VFYNNNWGTYLHIGGQYYSEGAYASWPWLQNQAAAEAMAAKVAQWPSLYKCDGIDLDIEGTAGNQVLFVI
jgi:hypothetical protein